MKHLSIYSLCFLLLLSFVAGCKDKQVEISPDATSDEELFELGQQSIEKDSEKGRLFFRQVIDSFPRSFYAQRAKLAIADSYFEQGDEGSMIIAASEYREFISLFPYSPSAAYAQYRIGMSYFEKALKPGRDQTKTQQALIELRQVITKYPLSDEANQAREHILECEERLAEHSFSIAHLYYKRRAYKASISRLTEILTEYPGYTKMDWVYFDLADSYFSSRMLEQSIPYFQKLISDYPNSKFAEQAVKKMTEIEKIQEKKE